MFTQHIDYIINHSNLKKQLLQINLAQLQNKLLQQQQQLDKLEQKFTLINTSTRQFKRRLYQLILSTQITNHTRLVKQLYAQRHAKIEHLTTEIMELTAHIRLLKQQIAQLKHKLNALKIKIEKFIILPELIDEEFIHDF